MGSQLTKQNKSRRLLAIVFVVAAAAVIIAAPVMVAVYAVLSYLLSYFIPYCQGLEKCTHNYDLFEVCSNSRQIMLIYI